MLSVLCHLDQNPAKIPWILSHLNEYPLVSQQHPLRSLTASHLEGHAQLHSAHLNLRTKLKDLHYPIHLAKIYQIVVPHRQIQPILQSVRSVFHILLHLKHVQPIDHLGKVAFLADQILDQVPPIHVLLASAQVIFCA